MKPTNINELRDQLLDAYECVKVDPLRVTQVREMTNAAARVISTLKVQLTYHALRQELPMIPFLECNTTRMINGEEETKQVDQGKSEDV